MLPGRRLNRQDIESERGVPSAVFAQKLPRNSRKMPLLLSRDRFLGRAELASRRRSRLHLDKRDRPAVVSHQIDFALHSSIGEISGDHYVSLPPQIPIRIRLAANSRSPRPSFCFFSRSRGRRIRQALSRGPVHKSKHCSSKNLHAVFFSSLLVFSVTSVPSVLEALLEPRNGF